MSAEGSGVVGSLDVRPSAPSANTYQAPGVKSAHGCNDVGFRRLSRFGLGSVVGL